VSELQHGRSANKWTVVVKQRRASLGLIGPDGDRLDWGLSSFCQNDRNTILLILQFFPDRTGLRLPIFDSMPM